MAASWDVFGTVYVGFSGNSYYYVQFNANDPQASVPTFTPAAGTYTSAQEVTIGDSTPNAAIYYTTDGSAPTTNSNLYGGAIAVLSGSETINAMVVASGYAPSSIGSATYSINATQPKAATPTFSPSGGTYTSVQSVTIGDSTPNAAIYYTTDGSTPTTNSNLYGGAIAVSSGSETINAIAAASGYSNSSVGSASYTINLPAPSFTISIAPASLSIQSGGQGSVTVTVTPANGFNTAVTFACSGLPSGVTCSFNPPSFTPPSVNSTQLTVAASSTVGAIERRYVPYMPETALAATIFLLGRKRRSLVRVLLIVLLTVAGFAPASGCGGGSSSSRPPPPVQAAVTVTATSGSLSQTGTFTLTVN
jgi:hypothetical protein